MLDGGWKWLPHGIYVPLDRMATKGRELERIEANRGPIPSVPAPYSGAADLIEIPGQIRFILPNGFELLTAAEIRAGHASEVGLVAAVAPYGAPMPGLVHTIRIVDMGSMGPDEDERDFFLLATVGRKALMRSDTRAGLRICRSPERRMVRGERAIWRETEYVVRSRGSGEPPLFIVIRTVWVLARRRYWDISLHVPRQAYATFNEPFWTVIGSLQWI